VVERGGNYYLRNGGVTFALPKPDDGPNGVHYLPGDWVTVTWSKGAVTKVQPGNPPAETINVGPSPTTRRGR
jgi:hypothetical protein